LHALNFLYDLSVLSRGWQPFFLDPPMAGVLRRRSASFRPLSTTSAYSLPRPLYSPTQSSSPPNVAHRQCSPLPLFLRPSQAIYRALSAYLKFFFFFFSVHSSIPGSPLVTTEQFSPTPLTFTPPDRFSAVSIGKASFSLSPDFSILSLFSRWVVSTSSAGAH